MGWPAELKSLPAFNRENFLKQSIDEVITQLYILVGKQYLK
jgi:hypothetical protein